MEPDFSTLAERKNSLHAIGKTASTLGAQSSGELTTMPAVNVGLRTQPPHMQTYYIDKQGNFIGIAGPLQGNVQTSTQGTPMQPSQLASPHFMPVASNPEKPSLHMSFATGPSTITHAPVPSGSNALPQSQPPVVHTCQSLSASVPSTIQVPVTPGSNQVQMTSVMNFGAEQVYKDQKAKKPGKYVCEYCSRACAKPSVLLKHIRSHTGERPYPCVTCGFSFKTKSNLYKHKKSHAHAIKLGLIARSESGSGSLSQESDKALGTHSEAEESGDSDEESSTADLDPDSSQSSMAALSENSLQGAGTAHVSHGETDSSAVFESNKLIPGQRAHEPKVTAALPKVVVYPVNVSPMRADSPRVTGTAPEQAAAQRQREFQTANLRSSITVLSSLKEVDGTNASLDTVSEDEDPHCKSPMLGGHAQLQRQQATDFSQQQQMKCLLSPRSLGSTDSGYFSRSESADQAMSPPSPFVKITPPIDIDIVKNNPPIVPPVVGTVMHVVADQRPRATEGQMRPPLEAKALSLEERISKLISDNEAVVDNKQLDSVKPRRTSLSRRGSIDSPKSYIFKDSFQFDLKPIGRRSSSSSDIPKSPFTPTDKSKPVFLLSVPSQYPPMDCLPITRSNSMPTTPGHSALPMNVPPLPHPLRICQSFDEKISSLNDDVFSSAPSTPNPAMHSRTLVRQAAVEDSSTSEGHGLHSVRSMDEGYYGAQNSTTEQMQRSRSFEHSQDRNRKPQQNKGTMYECETCRNRYRKLENFETHKKFYCSELHGPKNKPVNVKDTDQDVFHVNILQPLVPRSTGGSGILDQQTSIRKRRKMKSVGDEDDQSPTDTIPPCSVSFELPSVLASQAYSQHNVIVDIQPKNNQSKLPQIQLVARGLNASDSRLSPIRETQISTSTKGELQRQGSGTSVIRHTNSLSRPNSFETESLDRASPVDGMEKELLNKLKTDAKSNVTADSYHENISKPKSTDYEKQQKDQCCDGTVAGVGENHTPVHHSRLVRQNNIQVPEILVTEEPDREHETQTADPVDKPTDQFNWPQRSESLSKLPAEKLPPKKKRIRLAQMEHSSGESSFESSLSRSLSRDSSLSRCSSVSASFDREEPSRSESPSRGECVNKVQEPQCLPTVFNTLGVPGIMRRAASEQITCTQPSVEIACDYRSKSFDCGNVSPSRSLSPVAQPKGGQVSQAPQVPLIERRRGPLVRQMSLKIGPESQQPVRKTVIPIDKPAIANVSSLTQNRCQQIHIANRQTMAQPFILQSGESPLQNNEHIVQSINLGSPTQQPQIHGLPHPWHQTSRVQTCQKVQKPLNQILVCRQTIQNKPADSEEKQSFVPKYQLTSPALRASQTFSFANTQATQIALPVLTIPIANPVLSISKSSDVLKNVYVAQPNQQASEIKTHAVVLQGEQQRDLFDQTQAGAKTLPQILITHEQMHPTPPLSKKDSLPSSHSIDSDSKAVPAAKTNRTQTVSTHVHSGERAPSLGSLHCTQKLASVTLCPQQEPTASSKRMLSPANSLDIYMEKHQKRAKDEHGVACLTDGRSVNYLNSKMSEVTRQRKLTLVRQVCTTEPVDSPIETEAPPLPQVKTDGEKDSEDTDDIKPMSPDSTGLEKNTSTIILEEAGPVPKTTPCSQVTSMPAGNSLKPQEKVEEQRWSPAKSPIRPSSFHGGQVKLNTSVSVVNTKDSHRLSFPSLKTATTFTWCFLMKRKPIHVPQTDLKTSAYAAWNVSPNNPNPLGLPTKVVMSLFDSKQSSKKIHYTSAIRTSEKSDILSYSSKLKDVMPRKVPIAQKSVSVETRSKVPPETQASSESDKDLASKTEPRRVKIFDGGFKSNEEYIYVRGRGRGKYICEECGIRCKKPSMLRKHIRTHSDVRPYHCVHCNFSFKTKGNLTKHMKSKAHSKKCMEMGVPEGLIEDQDAEDSGDRSQVSSADRQDSDGDDSDGPDDEENDDNEEEEDDSQAESGLSTNPSVSASPQHIPCKEAEVPPSALLAQMSISSISLSHSQSRAPESHTSDSESVPMMSPVSLSKQISISASCYSQMPLPYSPPPVAATSESYTSDTESVHMMSPVSPCRQMSIDYPDFEVPPSPPVPGKSSKLGQDISSSSPAVSTSETGVPVDRGTQTSCFGSQGPMHFHPHGLSQTPGAHAQTHLFSHLPLHSQQPSRSTYSMVPVGGIQLVPAGLAAYSTFVPIQAGPVQLTIPAVSVIHRNTSPLPAPNTSPHPEGLHTQPLVVQEPLSNVLPCFPLGQVTGLQAQTIQPVGLEALNLMGLTNTGLTSTQLLSQQGLTLNATLGLQVLAANPTSQSSTGPQTHLPGLQILNIALPAIIPSLSPLSTLSPLPGSSEQQCSPEAPGAQPSQSEQGLGSLQSCMPASPPAPSKVSSSPEPTSGSRACAAGNSRVELTQTAGGRERDKSPQKHPSPAPQSREDPAKESPVEAARDPPHQRPRPMTGWHKVNDDYNEVSSDDEDRLVIAT
ncbi:zinc finger protein 40 isoform X2 [Notolabrus celidotus]|nr:zinc finger protein 40 isoform X2 [Notolabrus celidotus]